MYRAGLYGRVSDLREKSDHRRRSEGGSIKRPGTWIDTGSFSCRVGGMLGCMDLPPLVCIKPAIVTRFSLKSYTPYRDGGRLIAAVSRNWLRKLESFRMPDDHTFPTLFFFPTLPVLSRLRSNLWSEALRFHESLGIAVRRRVS